MGGMTSMQTMYHGNLLGGNKPNDILQEVLPNVVRRSRRAVLHRWPRLDDPPGRRPAPPRRSRSKRASTRSASARRTWWWPVVTTTGRWRPSPSFGDMAATADTEMMRAKGISDSKFSAPTTVAVSASSRPRVVAPSCWPGATWPLQMGLPVLAVVGYALVLRRRCAHLDPGSGPRCPGRRAAAAASRGWRARWPSWASVADDIAVISKHDTSTLANDPNETELHERLAASMGRSTGAPLFVGQPEEPDGPRQGWRRGVPDDGAVPDAARRRHPAEPQPGLRRRRAGHAPALRVGARDPAPAASKFPLKAGLIDQPRVRPRVGSGGAGAPAGVHGGAGSGRAAGDYQRACQRSVCWPVSGVWLRRSPVGRRCTRSRPIAGSTTTPRRSVRKPRCCSNADARLGADGHYSK